ncbi:MAG: ThuA domain-containing protein, partial [Phycisphaerales bacterium]|nr:ThuA domain-containing protein [Phycisphaerales bacterium]
SPIAEARRLLSVDESSYEGGSMGDDHPIAWCREFDGGRTIYTAGGHTIESYSEPDFRRHLLGALRWSVGPAD